MGRSAREGPDVDVLVVGAGPTGLALAAQLRAHGAGVRIVDRSPGPAGESRALAVQPRTLEVLAPLGVAGTLVERGNRAVRLQVHAPGRTVDVPLYDAGLRDTAYPFLLFVSQARTEQVLGEHLATRAVVVERGLELVGLAQGATSVTCRLRDAAGGTRTVRARYVVGCDGAHSTVRSLAGIAFTGERYPQSFVLADLEVDGAATGVTHAFVGAGGILLLFPLGGPATWRVVAMRPTGGPAGPTATLGEVQRLLDGYTDGLRVHDPVWLTGFGLARRVADRLRAGRVFLAGDAAHVHSPAGAQGMNTGIQDAVNLGWKLGMVCTGGAHPALLDTYEQERAPVARRVVRLTDRAFTVATSTGPPARVARAHVVPRVLPLVLRCTRLRRAGVRVVAELTIGYRGSALSKDHGRRRPARFGRVPRAGDRVPDLPLAGTGRLHDVLRVPGFHLLLTRATAGPRPAGVTVHRLVPDGSPDPDPTVLRLDGEALARLGLGPRGDAMLLLRPDGHIGLRGGADPEPLGAYLRRWLRAPSPGHG